MDPLDEEKVRRETEPIMFRDWAAKLSGLGLGRRDEAGVRSAIIGLLGASAKQRCPVSIALARHYLRSSPRATSSHDELVLWEAIRWFSTYGRHKPRLPREQPDGGGDDRAGHLGRSGAGDQGTSDWERALVSKLRTEGLLWRTEETYRRWAHEFVAFIRPTSPFAAGPQQLQSFLSRLAVVRRSSPATQKQALNALVFFLAKSLGRELGDFRDFVRAVPRRRQPVVLSKPECEKVFAQMSGTPLLMAKLAYGAGLRVMELLRLRIQEVDFGRLQITIRGGKGDKDRATVLPRELVDALQGHV